MQGFSFVIFFFSTSPTIPWSFCILFDDFFIALRGSMEQRFTKMLSKIEFYHHHTHIQYTSIAYSGSQSNSKRFDRSLDAERKSFSKRCDSKIKWNWYWIVINFKFQNVKRISCCHITYWTIFVRCPGFGRISTDLYAVRHRVGYTWQYATWLLL